MLADVTLLYPVEANHINLRVPTAAADEVPITCCMARPPGTRGPRSCHADREAPYRQYCFQPKSEHELLRCHVTTQH